MKSLIEVRQLEKSFGGLKILKGIDFKLEKGEILSIIGPSGGGKTTLLRCINGLEEVDKGEIIIGEKQFILNKETQKKLPIKLRGKIGTIFQDFNLWPNKTVLDNVALAPMLIKSISKYQAHNLANDLLRKMGIEDKGGVYPDFLSGGQKQRVAIARALAMKPDILLLDEITSGLDPELVSGMLAIIKKLATGGMTVIVVTHHLQFANQIADKIIFMDKGQIVESGSPEKILFNPKQERTKKFVSNMVEGVK